MTNIISFAQRRSVAVAVSPSVRCAVTIGFLISLAVQDRVWLPIWRTFWRT